MATLIIHSNVLNREQTILIETTFGSPTKVAQHYRVILPFTPEKTQLANLAQQLQIDVNLLPEGFNANGIKLVISDMDSTLISIECIDEIADFINVKPQVSAITEAAMRGELNFEESLTQRVALLKGLDAGALQHVYDERLTLNPGAQAWITGLKNQGIAFALVSGGFTFFTDRLKERLNLEFSRANVLDTAQNQLTGKVLGGIIGAQAKADFLHELCAHLNITPAQVIAVGDGANDLLMMQAAGLSVAYHAKPTVQAHASTALNFSGLNAILDFIA
ncbi:phosphoserine phosphatase SerB [Thiomicrorhabdus aquaedulcis]|uniref:phosphoserine phosphatase SerB n=1 Tax=Thiomicrorhabdus aquaedulcis TaxID=2211106 RepID=UPI000FDA55E2|nr:phosphoserine phosphatase SerB [Thiomicrorhabdus aquaedulcis]